MKISARATRATVLRTQKIPIDVLNNYIDPDSLALFTTRWINVESNNGVTGAVHDCKTVLDGGMTSGSAVLTSASNPFAASDVGKRIVVSRAGTSNVPLRTTIASFTNAGSVTLSNTAGATVTNQMVDWGTDDTPAILYAIIAANVNSGVVYFPNGTYMIDGDLFTSVSGENPNCQLYIPPTDDGYQNNICRSITFLGESAITIPNFRASVQKSGVVLRSTRLGSGTNPCVIGSRGITEANNPLNFVYIDIRMINVSVWVYTNNGSSAPSLTGIDLRKIHLAILDNVSANIDVSLDACASATGTETAGIIMPSVNCTGPNVMKNTSAHGFKYGQIIGEHTQMINLYSFGCNHGFVFPTQNYMSVGHISTTFCINQILFPNAAVMGLDHDTTKRGRVFLTAEYENDQLSKWWDTQTFLIDLGNRGRGKINYMLLSGGVVRNDIAMTNTTGGYAMDLIPLDGWQTLQIALTANQNNWSPTDSGPTSINMGVIDTLIVTPDAARDVTGINPVRYKHGREITIINASASFAITLKNESASSTAANRFTGGADIVIAASSTVKIVYDGFAARFRKIS